MKDDGFMKMIFAKLPPETELAVELRCREVWACEDTEKIKAFCIDLMKNHAKSEAGKVISCFSPVVRPGILGK